MPKIFKKILWLILAIIVIAVVVPFFIPINYYKPAIEAKVKEYTNREFKINGDINFALLPNISIKINKAQLASASNFSEKDFLKVEEASLILELNSLLRGKIIIKSVAINNAEVNLEVQGNVKNWEILSKSGKSELKEGEAPEAAKELGFFIENIKVSGSKVKYIENKQTTVISGLNLESKMQSLNTPLKSNFTFNVLTPQIKGEIKVKGETSYFEKIATFKGNVKALDGDFALSGELDINNTPKLILNLNTALLDINKFIQKNPKISTQRWPADKIDLSFLKNLNATINLNISKIKHDNIILDSVKAKAVIKDNAFQLNSFNANIFGGNLNLSFLLQDLNAQKWTLKSSLKDAKLNLIASSSTGKYKVTKGNISVNSNLNSYGSSIKSYVDNLAGNVNIEAYDGQISGIDLEKIVNSLNNINNLKNLPAIFTLINGAFAGGTTDFKSLKSNLLIKSGIATIQSGVLEAASATANAVGSINLPTYTMNINTDIIISKFPSIGVNFSGPIDSPAYKLDLSALKNHFTNNAVNSVIDNLSKGRVKPKDIIKGIIGGDNKKDDTNPEKPSTSPNKLIEGALKKFIK